MKLSIQCIAPPHIPGVPRCPGHPPRPMPIPISPPVVIVIPVMPEEWPA